MTANAKSKSRSRSTKTTSKKTRSQHIQALLSDFESEVIGLAKQREYLDEQMKTVENRQQALAGLIAQLSQFREESDQAPTADHAATTVEIPLLPDKGPVKPEDWTRARDIIRDNMIWFREFKRKLKKRPSTAQVLTAWDKRQADDEEALRELDEYRDRRKTTAHKLSDLATGREPSLVTAADGNLDADFDAEDYEAEERAAQTRLQQELARPPILPKQTTINAPNPGRSGSRRKTNGRKREAAKS